MNVIIGAGPAGLSASLELSRHSASSLVLEKDNTVGGLARTVEYKGYRFDIGGHRFFTKVHLVERLWRELLGEDFLTRPRSSRIFYRGHYFQYPIEPFDALLGLGPWEATHCTLSYLQAKLFPRASEESFEDWIVNRFGDRLYRTFFKTYTEKVWGMPCTEIRAEWAAQRIKGLSVAAVLMHALRRNGSQPLKTLINEFQYPRLGPGMMWERARDEAERLGARIVLNSPVERIRWRPGAVTSVVAGGQEYPGENFVSTMAIRDLIQALDPAPGAELTRELDSFRYRDFLTVALILEGPSPFPDNWVYVHSPEVQVGRIQNYNNWSPDMVPEPGMTCLGLEYFCFEGDGLWKTPDAGLIELAKREIRTLGLIDVSRVVDGAVVRMPKAYPVYDGNYQQGLVAVRAFLGEIPNLQLAGRNGMHRYNNQDHSMLTGILAARNILGAHYDLWRINVDAEYHEEGYDLTEEDVAALGTTQPLQPERLSTPG